MLFILLKLYALNASCTFYLISHGQDQLARVLKNRLKNAYITIPFDMLSVSISTKSGERVPEMATTGTAPARTVYIVSGGDRAARAANDRKLAEELVSLIL